MVKYNMFSVFQAHIQLSGWLVINKKIDMSQLKIATAEVFEESVESKILQHLRAGNVLHPGRKFVWSLLDEFSFSGPNGHHLCLVSEVGGCSVAESKENSLDFMFPLVTAKAIAAQVAMGLAYMHSCGVGHGGESASYHTGDSLVDNLKISMPAMFYSSLLSSIL